MLERHSVMRALVVDYSTEVIELVRAVLHAMNGIDHVDMASTGDIAVTLLDLNEYDIVIVEAVVPFGEESLLRYIARTRPSICARLIVMTPPPIEAAVLKDIELAKPLAIFEKPFDIVSLAEAVRDAMRSSPQHMAGRYLALAL